MFGFGKKKEPERHSEEWKRNYQAKVKEHKYTDTLPLEERVAYYERKREAEREANRKKSRAELKMDKKNEEFKELREKETELVCKEVEENMNPVFLGKALPLPTLPEDPNDFFPRVMVTNERRYEMLQNDLEIFKTIENHLAQSQSKLFLEFCSEVQKFAPIINLKSNNEALNKYDVALSRYAQIPEILSILTGHMERAKAFVDKELAIIGSGIHGENRVNQELDMHNYLWTNLKNIRFEVDGESVESDNIIVCRKGIFTVEVKNYASKGNYSLAITRDGQWQKVYPNGKREVINSVTSQVSRHVGYKQKVINKAWKVQYPTSNKTIMVEPIFVLANDKVQVQNDANLPIMRASQIYYYLKDKPDVLTDTEVTMLTRIVQANNLPPKTYEFFAIAEKLMEAYYAINKEMVRLSKFTGYVELIGIGSQKVIDNLKMQYPFRYQEVDVYKK